MLIFLLCWCSPLLCLFDQQHKSQKLSADLPEGSVKTRFDQIGAHLIIHEKNRIGGSYNSGRNVPYKNNVKPKNKPALTKTTTTQVKESTTVGGNTDGNGNKTGKGLSKLKNDINPSDGGTNCVACAISLEKKITQKVNQAVASGGTRPLNIGNMIQD